MDAVIQGQKERPVAETSLVQVLFAQRGETKPWLVFHRGRTPEPLSPQGAWELSQGWAQALTQVGVGPGDRVALLLPNGPDFIGAFFGAQCLGATAVPLPWPVLQSGDLTLPRGAEAVLALTQATALCAPKPVPGLELPTVLGPSTPTAQRLVTAQAPAFVQFTSGSTGAPRGAVISQRAAVTSAWAMSQGLQLGPDSVGVSWLPFFHDMGLVGVLLASLVSRFPVHLMAPGDFLLHPWRWMELASQVKATLGVAPNFAFELALRRRGKGTEGLDLSSLRALLNGSEPVLRSTVQAFEDAFAPMGLKRGTVLPVYGLAENTLGVAFQPLGAPDADLEHESRRVPSVGGPLPGMDVAIRRPDGQVARQGEEGEITVSSGAMMERYLGDEAATARALRDGWLWTGDRGVISQGRLHVTGREKDLVIKSGRKFHPADIERLVADAVDAPPNGVVAFSVLKEAARGEELVVVVELRRRQGDDVVGRIRGKIADELGVMADRVELVGAGDLPRTTSGKLRRHECIARYGGA